MSSTEAINLRKKSTDAERLLWQKLRNRQIAGLKFRRQHKIGKYIADFVCIEKKMIIEVDGSQHADRQEYDNNRTAFLEKEGYKVLRFWDNEVLIETEAVLEKMYSFTLVQNKIYKISN